MNSVQYLTEGQLDLILQQRNTRLHPIVQILDHKVMESNNRVRVLIHDGHTSCQHCVLVTEELDELYQQGNLSRYTIVRIEEYSVSSLENVSGSPVILVNRVTIVKPGNQVNKKLESGEGFSIGVVRNTLPLEQSPTSPPNTLSSYEPEASTSHRPETSPLQQCQASTTNTSIANRFPSQNICPITTVTPYFSAWVLRVQVNHKTPVRTYNNQKGGGKLFSFDVSDDSGEIRFVAFNAQCDRIYDQIEVGKFYYISKGRVKAADKRFNSLNSDYEITVDEHTDLELCTNAILSPIKIRYKFIKLAELVNQNVGTFVDIIGVIRSKGVIESITPKKNSKMLNKLELTLVDKSMAEVRVTLWNEVSNDFKGEEGQVMAMRSAAVSEFMGKTLSYVWTRTRLELEPQIPETHILHAWYSSHGFNETFNKLSWAADHEDTRCFLSKLTTQALNLGENKFFSVNASLQHFVRNHSYKSCDFNGCSKKLEETDNGQFHCSNCNRSSSTFSWHLLMSFELSDVSGCCLAQAFGKDVEDIFGMSTAQILQIYHRSQSEFGGLVRSLYAKQFKFLIKTQCKEYNNEQRLSHSICRVSKINSTEQAKQLMKDIDALSSQCN